MKKLILLICLVACAEGAFALHLKGGFFTYQYLGPGAAANSAKYHVVLTAYMVCNPSEAQLAPPVNFTIFDAGSVAQVANINVPISQQYPLQKTGQNPCIQGDQSICYYIVIYDLDSVELPINQAGYVISYQRCCRITGIQNISGSSDAVGNTYSITIPGLNKGPSAPFNSSAVFHINDTVLICRNSYFQYNFQATDPNNDSLSYYFCDAWNGGSTSNSAPDPADAPPYPYIPYNTGFTGSTPLGMGVTINPVTGIISGISPSLAGEYVVCVCVNEYKNGVLLAQNRKELHFKVNDCTETKATLDPQYVNCKDFTVLFHNNSPNNVATSFWDFGVPSLTNDTSNLAAPNYVYPDTGTYYVKLVVNRGQNCSDSSTAPVKVFPGFFPNFGWQGICNNHPTQFHDSTTTLYGLVNSWSWNFGDNGTLADTSHIKNPAYTYALPGTMDVQFVVTTDKGCRDTLHKQVTILDKPPIIMPFRDTLICQGDTLQLHATTPGNYQWTPNVNIINPNTANPWVYPNTPGQMYTVHFVDNSGCTNTDSVRVRAVTVVTLIARPDSTICFGDSVMLGAISDGLRYLWTPSANMNDPTLQFPTVRPSNVINTYEVLARIGHCTKKDTVIIYTAPYPKAYAGTDTTICYNSYAQLHGTKTGTNFSWSPTIHLTNYNTLNPLAHPPDTITYTLQVWDTSFGGCPKPVTSTVHVNVPPKVHAFAGRDTSVVVGQPLQFEATGGVSYLWSPGTGLSATNIYNPVGFYDAQPDFIRYKVIVGNEIGCKDSAYVNVRVFKTIPWIFVPTAFTPNGDGNNDKFKPIAVGMARIEYFRVYNRWGELVFETTINGEGWDGKIKGQDQGTNVFVWLVKAYDFRGKEYFAKGTVTLIK